MTGKQTKAVNSFPSILTLLATSTQMRTSPLLALVKDFFQLK